MPVSRVPSNLSASPRQSSRRRGGGQPLLLWFVLSTLLIATGAHWSLWLWSQQTYSTFHSSTRDSLSSFASPEYAKSSTPNRQMQEYINNDPSSSNQTTLALLYPPGLLGGYRNQVMRFMALIDYGKRQQINQLMLPSLLWSTKINEEWRPIPMEWVFDITHWNNNFDDLPRIVAHVDGLSDCWMHGKELQQLFASSTLPASPKAFDSITQSILQGGTIGPLVNTTLPLLTLPIEPGPALRKTDHFPTVQHCQNPFVYGGGMKAGRLWNDYMQMTKTQQQQQAWHGQVYQALQPAPQWRTLADTKCAGSIALHARVEVEMMQHRCGRDMERNLTTIVGMVQQLFGTDRSLLIAVSRHGMTSDHQNYQEIAQSNVRFLDQAVNKGHVFECGSHVLEEYYKAHAVPHHGTLLESVINFYAAVSAETFVGVKGSSYSNDVWTTRYWMGKGDQNFRYTNERTIVPVQGLPKPHTNCNQKRRRIAKP